MHKKKQYNPAIDALRFISILGVICIHTTTRTLEASGYDLQRLPWTLFLNQLFRFAVPLFFMISGFVLELNYSYHANYYTYLKKRINRILIPYIFWSAIYYFFVYKQHTINFIQTLLTGQASYQLYFIPALLIFYLIFPLIHRYYEILIKRELIILFGISQLLLLYYDYYIHPLTFYLFNIILLNYFIFFIGIIAARHKDKVIPLIEKWKLLLFPLTIIFALFIFFEGRNRYIQTHNYLAFYSQWRPSVLIYTLLLAGSLYYLFNKRLPYLPVIKTLSRLSFFVFFIHVIVLEILWYTLGIKIFHQPHSLIAQQVWYDPLFCIVVTFISFSTAYIAHKIPKLAKISG